MESDQFFETSIPKSEIRSVFPHTLHLPSLDLMTSFGGFRSNPEVQDGSTIGTRISRVARTESF